MFCSACGYISCVCDAIATHDRNCRWLTSVTCPVEIECDHGYSVCAECDSCNCSALERISNG